MLLPELQVPNLSLSCVDKKKNAAYNLSNMDCGDINRKLFLNSKIIYLIKALFK